MKVFIIRIGDIIPKMKQLNFISFEYLFRKKMLFELIYIFHMFMIDSAVITVPSYIPTLIAPSGQYNGLNA